MPKTAQSVKRLISLDVDVENISDERLEDVLNRRLRRNGIIMRIFVLRDEIVIISKIKIGTSAITI